MIKKFFCLTPFYPVRVIPNEDYFYVSVVAAKQLGLEAELFSLSRYTPQEAYRLIPERSLIHCHGMTRKMYELYWRLKFNRKASRMVITPHTSFGYWGMFGSFIPFAVSLVRQFNALCAISPYENDFYKERGINSSVLGLGIDTELFSGLGRERNKQGILFFGGGRKEKNSKTLLEALRLINTDVTVTITECAENTDSGNIRYRKRVDAATPEYAQLFREHSIFINSSYNEGFPLGVMEAYASGMKCCISDIPTLRSIYGESALYHHPDDHRKLAQNIKQCLDDDYPDRSTELIKRYDYKTVIEKLAAIYKELI
ncbi:MAG: glycosyltransferase family 4 protein [Candidatus Omnitrophota bacterium]